jgi:hypothetical protein
VKEEEEKETKAERADSMCSIPSTERERKRKRKREGGKRGGGRREQEPPRKVSVLRLRESPTTPNITNGTRKMRTKNQPLDLTARSHGQSCESNVSIKAGMRV